MTSLTRQYDASLLTQRLSREVGPSQSRKISDASGKAGQDSLLIIPSNLVDEVESFIMRNTLNVSTVNNSITQGRCCPQCLKAHILRTAKKRGFNQKMKTYLKCLFPHEEGHLGYYMDQGAIIKI